MKGVESEQWGAACDKEIEMLRRMKVWKEVELPTGKRDVSSKCVFGKKKTRTGW